MLQFQVAQLVGSDYHDECLEQDSGVRPQVLTDAAKVMQNRLEKEVPKKDDASIAEMRKEDATSGYDAGLQSGRRVSRRSREDDGGDEETSFQRTFLKRRFASVTPTAPRRTGIVDAVDSLAR
jgi:hypothetical protein